MKRVCMLVLLVLLASAGAFSTGQPEAEGSVKEQVTRKLIFSSVSVPKDTHTEAMYVFKEELEKLSAGQLVVDIYHSGQLYNQLAEHEALKKGMIAIGYTYASWWSEAVPYCSMFGAFYMYRDYDHMTKVLNGPLGQKMAEDVAQKLGVRPISSFYLGTRNLNLRDIGREVKRPEDMKGVKLRMAPMEIILVHGRALGANPVPLSFGEIYLALKTGTVDGQENPIPTIVAAKFYEVTKYHINTKHMICPTVLTFNEEIWQSLSSRQQGWVRKAAEKAREYCDTTNLKKEEDLVGFLREQGIIFVEPDREAFGKFAREYYQTQKNVVKDWDMNLYKQIQDVK